MLDLKYFPPNQTLLLSDMNVFLRYFSRSGRIPKAIWFGRLLIASAYALAFGMLADAAAGPVASAIVAGVFLASTAAISVQRLHDTGDSGAWLFVALIPVAGPIWLLLKLLRRGVPGPNRYGPDSSNRLDYLKVDISR
ncbi:MULTISPECIES: DUF805 domain-containing protein [unclassified Duganella]|uniref:DUF805 domain-containing protein n=1 Tax=unclassified Duganella TaxID=2636909 RepID=UPI000E3550E8|nr:MULTISPECIES: DUF805 domain-containing protein [unclassified Duganella]RFP15913.1 DUF805 domain-containing protein [Duganella sp. BJB475]RFP32922.1 DUF805 domain-containing protein [Duganella sp. BJB476]